MDIFKLLILLSIIVPIGDCFYGGIRSGIVGGLVGMISGITIGVCNLYGVLAVYKICWNWIKRREVQKLSLILPTRVVRLLIFSVYMWIFISSVGGMLITQYLARWFVGK
jgi:hypothetical protein